MTAAFWFYLIPAAFCVLLVCRLTCLAPLSGSFGASQVSGNGKGGGGGVRRPGGYHLPETSKNQPGGCEDVLAGCLATGWQSSKGKASLLPHPCDALCTPRRPRQKQTSHETNKENASRVCICKTPFSGSQGSQWGIQQNVPRVMDSYKICNSQAFLWAFSYRSPHPTEWATGPPNLDLLLFVVIGITYGSSAGSIFQCKYCLKE